MIDGLPVSDDTTKELKNVGPEYLKLSKKDLAREIKKLEKEMLKNARELEFEKAALVEINSRKLKQFCWIYEFVKIVF